ncbi:MAG: hypothetical protein IPQ03_18080 [Bacteroidetes bacterium]|nr:hypothetical protein [Bacteroidota bacterium]
MLQSGIIHQFVQTQGAFSFRAKDPFSNVYLNKGAYKDAIHFLQVDPDPNENKKRKESKPSFLNRLGAAVLKMIYRFYLLLWFSLYYSISMLGKLLR